MTIAEAAQKMREISIGTSANMTKFVRTRVAQDLMVAVKDRWIRRGVTYDGRLLAYSTRPTFVVNSDYPLNRKAFAVLSKSEKKSYNKAKKILTPETFASIKSKDPKQKRSAAAPGGYKQIRQVAGYQVNHVDFDITTDMWRSVKVKSVQLKGTIIEVIYGPTDTTNAFKIAGHNKHFNTNILMPNTQELQISSELIESYVIAEIKKRFGG
jgi:hypothetical protein